MGYGRSGDKKPRGASRRSRTRPEAPGGPWGLPGSRRPRTRTLGRSNPGVRGVQTLGSPGGPGGPKGLWGVPGVGWGSGFCPHFGGPPTIRNARAWNSVPSKMLMLKSNSSSTFGSELHAAATVSQEPFSVHALR